MQCHTTMRNFIFSGIPNKISLFWDFFFPKDFFLKARNGKNSEILMEYRRPQVTKLILTKKKTQPRNIRFPDFKLTAQTC